MMTIELTYQEWAILRHVLGTASANFYKKYMGLNQEESNSLFNVYNKLQELDLSKELSKRTTEMLPS